MLRLQLTLAARYLLGRKLRTALTTLAIVFGTMVIFGMDVTANDASCISGECACRRRPG